MLKTFRLGFSLFLFLERVCTCDYILLFLHASVEIWSFNFVHICVSSSRSVIIYHMFLTHVEKTGDKLAYPTTSVLFKTTCCGQPLLCIMHFFIFIFHVLHDFNLSTDLLCLTISSLAPPCCEGCFSSLLLSFA